MERWQISQTVEMTFGLLAKGSEDDRAIKELLVLPEIWEPQRRDEDDISKVANGEFSSTIGAVFRRANAPIGYVLFVQVGQTLFVQHTAFIEEERGMAAMRCIEDAHRALFCLTPATEVITHAPDWSPQSRALAARMGGVRMSYQKNFSVRDGRMQGATIFRLSVFDWACGHHEEFQEAGEAWHEQVFAKIEPHHEDDPAHNSWLGLALEMGKRQPQKAVMLYNLWAARAGYVAGSLLWASAEGHSLIDIGNATCLNGPQGVLAVIPKCQSTPKDESTS